MNLCQLKTKEKVKKKIKLLLKSRIDEEKKKVTNNFKKKFEDVHKSYIKLSYLEKIIKNLRQ